MGILTRNRFRKRAFVLMSLLAFLLFAGISPFALAADVWPTWPPPKREAPAPADQPTEPITEGPIQEGVPPTPPPAAPGAEAAGAAAGSRASAGISRGTLGWAAAIIGAGVVIGVAAGGGGGGGSTPIHNN